MLIVINIERGLLMAKYNAIYEGRLPDSIRKAAVSEPVSRTFRFKYFLRQVLSGFSKKVLALFKN